ncbi:MAG: Uma2 family endonuclease [Bryobacteraceae bacterium]
MTRAAPDFVIEIRSPQNRIADQKRKLDDYFANGCRLAWLVIPEERSVRRRCSGSRTYPSGL